MQINQLRNLSLGLPSLYYKIKIFLDDPDDYYCEELVSILRASEVLSELEAEQRSKEKKFQQVPKQLHRQACVLSRRPTLWTNGILTQILREEEDSILKYIRPGRKCMEYTKGFTEKKHSEVISH